MTLCICKNAKKIRESNIELYRIFLMLLIIAHHYVVNSGLLDLMYQEPFSSKSIFLFIFGAWGKIGINCFVLITGYYMCTSKITLKKFLKLLLEIEFYKICIYMIFIISSYESFNIKSAVKAILPVTSIASNFVGCYLMFYLLIPFINILIKNISKKQHIVLLAILLFIYSILGNIPTIDVGMNYVSWFFVIYLIGSYIRLYSNRFFESKKVSIIGSVLIIFIDILSIICSIYIGQKFNRNMAYYFISDSNKLLAILAALFIFLTFKNIKIKYNRCINKMAESVFGVLLIHANSDAMRKFLWVDLLHNKDVFSLQFYDVVIHSVICTISIFIVCVIIDQIRIKFTE